jgi:hypothetical protein
MRKLLLIVCCTLMCVTLVTAQATRNANGMVPSGKGFGVPAPSDAVGDTVTQGNGINYHNGPVLSGNPINVYIIWYGNWVNGKRSSDSQTTVNLIDALFGAGGMGNSPYFTINTTYGDTTSNVSGNIQLANSYTDSYSKGTRLSDNSVKTVVSNAISGGHLANDATGIYFVLTSSDVSENSGFCSVYCGWHTHATISGSDIKYAFVGNPDRCSSACEAQTISPNSDSGADGMASIMAHEAEEAATDPDLNAWYDSSGAENGDKCAWKWGLLLGGTVGNAGYNEVIGGHNWLIQMDWENSRGGGCDNYLGGTFYTK